MRKRFNNRKMEAGVKLLLEGMGVPLDADFRGTPTRVARLYREILTPRVMRKAVSFPGGYNGMVTLRHHIVFTVCPHHLLPVKMDVSIGYIPQHKMLGLSKLARIAEAVLTRPMKQEDYTDAVAAMLSRLCDPLGLGVYVIGEHGCMRHRGVRTSGDVVTSTLRKAFFTNAATKAEFLEMVR